MFNAVLQKQNMKIGHGLETENSKTGVKRIIVMIEWSSIECRKTKAITLTNHKR